MIIGLYGDHKIGEHHKINWNPITGEYHDDQPIVILRKATQAEFITYHMAQDYREQFMEMVALHPLDAEGYWEVSTD